MVINGGENTVLLEKLCTYFKNTEAMSRITTYNSINHYTIHICTPIDSLRNHDDGLHLMTKHEELLEALKDSHLCALPQSASQMLELSKDPSNGPQEYAKPISADLGLSTQILRFVNSSFFGFHHKVTSIPLALSLVSVRTIRNFVLWNGLFTVLPDPHCGPFSIKVLFQDALRRAVFARIVTERYTKLDSDEAFTCALVQDMAIPVLAAKWETEYADMFHKSIFDHVRLSSLEREAMGWDHAYAGAVLAVRWNLGELISRVVSQHTNNVFHGDTCSASPIVGITALSAFLPKMHDSQWYEVVPFVDAYQKLFGQKLTDIGSILDKTDAASSHLTGLINLGAVSKTLSDYWRESLANLHKTGEDDMMVFEELLEEYFAAQV